MRIITFFISLLFIGSVQAADIFVEAEHFDQKGGWMVDQQFMDLMGSPYLLAHGMGRPVEDAHTVIDVTQVGEYTVYVRTYNWTSPWSVKSGAGAFQIGIGGRLFSTKLGTSGNRWLWQYVGKRWLTTGKQQLTLHDKTGFEGRCDAIFLTTESKSPARPQRQQAQSTLRADLIVVGGGIAGMCAAASASRLGCKVLLVNDRPVLGGNNSSEVRVHLGGVIEIGANKGLGRMIREFGHSRGGNAHPADFYEDAKKDSFIRAEQNITLLKCHHADSVVMVGHHISSVYVTDITTGVRRQLTAPLVVDCTGDGAIGALAGADYLMGREPRSEYGESLAPVKPDSLVMGASIQWYSEEQEQESPFPEFNYGMAINLDNCQRVVAGEWTWETGMNRNQIIDAEQIRDYGLLVVYSNWSYLKNHLRDNVRWKNRHLEWVAYVAGKRESRRLLGDYVLKQDDIEKNVYHEDASFCTTWSIDLHFADSLNCVQFPGHEFKSATIHRFIHPYDVPYRCLYSRNIDNLFMAGRDISVTHVALGTVRVMRTTGMMGEVVGMATSLCYRYHCSPREVYMYHFPELHQLMERGIGRDNVPDNQHFNEPSKLLSKATALK